VLLRRAHDDGVPRHDQRPGQKPDSGLGYTVTYAVGNTLLTIWGMVTGAVAGLSTAEIKRDGAALLERCPSL
jgi:hypothetical protein